MGTDSTGHELLARARNDHYVTRDVAAAWNLYEQALEAFDRDGDEAGAVAVLSGLAQLRTEQGWWTDAVALVHEARARAMRSQLEGLAIELDSITGEIALRSGDGAGAARIFARALAAAAGTRALGGVLMRSARTFQDDGDFDEAARRLERAGVEFERIGDPRRASLARTRLALIAIERGDPDAAIQTIEDARAGFDEQTDPLIVREAWLYSCAAHALAGRFSEAEAALAAARVMPEAWSSARHSRHYIGSFEALIIACRARTATPVDEAGLEHARNAIIAAETPGADGCSAVNCFYVLRACVRLIRRALPEHARPIGSTRVADDGTWFQLVDGRTVELAHRPVLARVLGELAAAAAAAPPRTATVTDLLQAGWSVDSAVGTSGELRVYTSILRLRKLGLRDAIVAVPGGYRLEAEVVVRSTS